MKLAESVVLGYLLTGLGSVTGHRGWGLPPIGRRMS